MPALRALVPCIFKPLGRDCLGALLKCRHVLAPARALLCACTWPAGRSSLSEARSAVREKRPVRAPLWENGESRGRGWLALCHPLWLRVTGFPGSSPCVLSMGRVLLLSLDAPRSDKSVCTVTCRWTVFGGLEETAGCSRWAVARIAACPCEP